MEPSAKNSITIDEIRHKAVPILKNAGITRSAVFGSVARGEAGDDSDIDILIEFERKMTLFDLVGLEQELEDALGRKVDIVTRRSIYPPLKKYIEKDEISIL